MIPTIKTLKVLPVPKEHQHGHGQLYRYFFSVVSFDADPATEINTAHNFIFSMDFQQKGTVICGSRTKNHAAPCGSGSAILIFF
jgi:hypothetical protein